MSTSSAHSTHTSRTSHSFAQSLASLRHSNSAGGGSGSRHRLKPASSISRQENRLGITTDYTDLSLHSAAAKGNVGLVQYALSHGQPVNSVLNGVLPLHAAASSGNETVVRMLIEAGADVNSPRLPRRYTNERSRTSGLAAGTQGSTPLHFAAANGHVSIIKLLLSYGADARVSEKYGLTPETIALQQGHIEAADVLKTWQPLSSSQGSDDAASIRSKTSLRSINKKRIHPQRSFDAIATKISQHAAHPHLPGLHSSASIASLTSLGASSVSPNASSSQISLGAASGPSGSSTPTLPPNRRSSISHPSLGLAKDSASNPRRPSLPSVWEKAAHPRATIRQALGMSKIGSKGSEADRRALVEAMVSRSSLGSAMGEEYALEEEDEDEEEEGQDGVRDEARKEKEERRRSMEVHRPLRMDSFTKMSDSTPPASAPPTQTSFTASDLNSLTSTTSTLRPDRSPALSRAPSGSKHELYRPRMSSQLSMSEQDGEAGAEGTKVDVEPEQHEEKTPSRQRSVSNPQPESRSPLLQQLHQNLLDDAATTTNSPFLYSASSTTPSPASSRRPSTGATAGLADHELSSDGSNASRMARPTAADVRRAFSIQVQQDGRNRSDSLGSSTTSSISRPPTAPSLAPPPALAAVQARAEANRNRSDSTASSLSTNSFLGNQSNFSYAGTASTAPTSVAPSSPGTRAEQQFHLPGKGGRVPTSLAPLYESKQSQLSDGTTSNSSASGLPTDKDQLLSITRAQARSRVQKAERDLLSYQPSSSKTSNASSGNNSGGSKLSLRDQLALYGKSLAIEREVVAKEKREEDEKEKKGDANGGFRIETIGSSSKPVTTSSPVTKSSTASTQTSASIPPVPAWRAVPTGDRLMPPPTLPHVRQSVSPRRHHRGTPTIPEHPTPTTSTPSTAKSSPNSKDKEKEFEHPSSPLANEKLSHRRPSTPDSITGSTVSGGGAGPAPTGAVLGTGIGGVQFVEVAKEPPHPHHHHHSSSSPHHKHATGKVSDRSHSDKGTSVTTSVRDQVEEERREKERREASIPRAVLTASGKKKGIKGWFK